MKKFIYEMLRDDIINKLRNRFYGEQFINDVLDVLGLHKIPIFNHLHSADELEIAKLKAKIDELESVIKHKEYEIHRLKNPLPPAKYKVGERAGNLAIVHVGDDNTYSCIDGFGKIHGCFREEDITAMMKLNKKAKRK